MPGEILHLNIERSVLLEWAEQNCLNLFETYESAKQLVIEAYDEYKAVNVEIGREVVGSSHWAFLHASLCTAAKELHRVVSLVDIRLHEIAVVYHRALGHEEPTS